VEEAAGQGSDAVGEGDFEPARVRRLVVRLDDGGERVWWVRTSSSAAGVIFDLREVRDPVAQRGRLPRAGAALLN
jgi:hypothetical protein